MGRKIPAKKHRGVKDPLVQQARRLQSLKGKINAPPNDPDDQPIPSSLKRLFAFQDRDKSVKKKTKRNNNNLSSTDGVEDNPVARLKKLPGESGRGFSLRINSAVRALTAPAASVCPDDAEPDDAKGQRMAAHRERRRRRAAPGCPERPARADRLALRKRAKLAEAAEEAQWAERTAAAYERVQFGDVAHAPPALPPPARAPPPARPAQRGLLLTALLAGAGAGAGAGAEAARRERAREDAVAAYRALKTERRLRERTARKRS